MKQSNGIAAVVVTFQSAATLRRCLERLCLAIDIAEIAIVDNGSTDGTLAILEEFQQQDQRIRLSLHRQNGGFAQACNLGAELTTSDWLAFINPDLMVEIDTLAHLRDYACQMAPVLLGVEQVNEAGVPDPAVRRVAPCFREMLKAPLTRSSLTLAVDSQRDIQEVPAISGALVFVSRSFFQALGGWDAGYRLHAEDLDLCRRAYQHGGRVAVVNTLRVVHVRGVSSRSRPWFVEWHKHRGLWRYFCKFERENTGLITRTMVWLAIWAHGLIKFSALFFRRLLRHRLTN